MRARSRRHIFNVLGALVTVLSLLLEEVSLLFELLDHVIFLHDLGF